MVAQRRPELARRCRASFELPHAFRPRPRSGHDQLARGRLRPERRRAWHGPAGVPADLSRSPAGSSTIRTEIWATQSGVMHEALREGGHHRPRRRGHRHHEPARDDASSGSARRGVPSRERDRLAGPENRARLRRAARRRPRGVDHREDRPRPRPLFLRHEAEVAARPRAGRAGPRGEGRARVRHDGHAGSCGSSRTGACT